MIKPLVSLLLLFTFSTAPGQEFQFDDADQEQRYRRLIAELRCLVCQNQNLADSNADLAKDLRVKTYGLLKSGASDAEIIDYMVNRYGDFVLYRPPFKTTTLLLWIGPFMFLLVGFIIILALVKRQRNRPPPALSDEDRERAHRLLREE